MITGALRTQNGLSRETDDRAVIVNRMDTLVPRLYWYSMFYHLGRDNTADLPSGQRGLTPGGPTRITRALSAISDLYDAYTTLSERTHIAGCNSARIRNGYDELRHSISSPPRRGSYIRYDNAGRVFSCRRVWLRLFVRTT